jgi:hypothetical protein
MFRTAVVNFDWVGTAKSAANMLPVTWVEVADSPDGSKVRLKPIIAPCAIGDTPTSPMIVEDGTVLTPALARMAKSAAVPRSTVRSGETAAAGTAGTGRNYVI